MLPHPIRLRHPWEQAPGEAGCVNYLRRFNSPTGLEAHEHVHLEIDRAIFTGQVTINGVALGPLAAGEFFSADATPHLRPQNELCVQVDPHSKLPAPPPTSTIYVVDDEPLGSPVGDVRLVIRG